MEGHVLNGGDYYDRKDHNAQLTATCFCTRGPMNVETGQDGTSSRDLGSVRRGEWVWTCEVLRAVESECLMK